MVFKNPINIGCIKHKQSLTTGGNISSILHKKNLVAIKVSQVTVG
jgi:hypothetical protein